MTKKRATIRTITASWTADRWYVKDGIVYLTYGGVELGFDLSKANLPDDPKPKKPLNMVLEIPYRGHTRPVR